MSAPFATVTGPIYNGDGQLLASGNVIFTREVWDNVAGEFVSKSRIVSRVVGGAMSQDLVLTTGDAGVLWYATMEYLDVATGNTISDLLGRFALTVPGATVPLVDILGADDAPEPTVPDALVQCLAAAASAEASAAAAASVAYNGTWLFTSGDLTVTTSSTVTVPHGLGRAPREVDVWLKCVATDGGYAVGDQVKLSGQSNDASGVPVGVQVVIPSGNTTQIVLLVGTYLASLSNKSTPGSRALLTASKWVLVVKAR